MGWFSKLIFSAYIRSVSSFGIESSVDLGIPRNEHFLPRNKGNRGTFLNEIPLSILVFALHCVKFRQGNKRCRHHLSMLICSVTFSAWLKLQKQVVQNASGRIGHFLSFFSEGLEKTGKFTSVNSYPSFRQQLQFNLHTVRWLCRGINPTTTDDKEG
jgi:hypothetical protein